MAKIHYDVVKTTNSSDSTLFNFSRCSLVSLSVPKSKQLTMCRILKPFVKHFEVLGNAVEIVETDQSVVSKQYDAAKPRIPPYTVTHDQMTSPAISVILFLPEYGRSRAEKVRSKFLKAPWQIHHSIQLQNHKSSDVIGKHDFYFLSRSYPLWGVCSAPQSSRVLRINIFVRRYSAMVEFYRLITGSEMESTKPGFCVFTLNTHNYNNESDRNHFSMTSKSETSSFQHQTSTRHTNDNISVELALKHSPQINPFSITNAYLTFPVTSIIPLRTVLTNYIHPLTSTHYLIHDPDGNPVVLYDLSAVPTHQNTDASSKSSTQRQRKDCISSPNVESAPSSSSINSILSAASKNKVLLVEKASIGSESWDSGRFSDFETTSCTTSDLDQCMAKLFPGDNRNGNNLLHKDFEELGFRERSFQDDIDDVTSILESLNESKINDEFYSETEDEEGDVSRVKIGDLSLIGASNRNTYSARTNTTKK